MTDNPLWFERTRWYFHNNYPAAVNTIEQDDPPRTRLTTNNGLPQEALDNLPDHLTIVTDNPTTQETIIVEYTDDDYGTDTDLDDLLD